MEKRKEFQRSMLVVAGVTIMILLVPFVAMQFTKEVVWTVSDFIVASALLFGTGLSYLFILRGGSNAVYRLAAWLAVAATVFMVWASLAVGLIGAGTNPGNLLYLGVLAVEIVCVVLSRRRAIGLERALYATALTFVLVIAIALLTDMDEYPGSSVMEIVGVNGFFIALFSVSALLFRYSAKSSGDTTVGA